MGQRLAYDAAKGRLWVVCVKCERWNLSPLEDRWEAIEEAERIYRDTKKRVATDNIGLARLRDGTDLVRIGSPLRPEFAAWRYGRSFVKRRRRGLLIAGAGATAAIGSVAVGASLIGPVVLSLAAAGGMHLVNYGMHGRTRAVLRADDGEVWHVSWLGLHSSVVGLLPDGRPMLAIQVHTPAKFRLTRALIGKLPMQSVFNQLSFSGTQVDYALGVLLCAMNGYSGSSTDLSRATSLIENSTTTSNILQRLSPKDRSRAQDRFFGPTKAVMKDNLLLADLHPAVRLALEMSLHEDSERRAMDGELAALELRWKEAEEIAAISDSLTLPGATAERLDALKRNPATQEADFPSQTD